MGHRHLFSGAFDAIALVVVLSSYLLPLYAARFWFSWYTRDRHGKPLWRRIIGVTAAVLATCSIIWRFIFPVILHQHYLRVGSEDQAWWIISLRGIQIGVWLSAGGLLLALFALGKARVYAAVSSTIMGITYFVLFAIR